MDRVTTTDRDRLTISSLNCLVSNCLKTVCYSLSGDQSSCLYGSSRIGAQVFLESTLIVVSRKAATVGATGLHLYVLMNEAAACTIRDLDVPITGLGDDKDFTEPYRGL